MNTRDLTHAFNERFDMKKTEVQIRSTLKNHKITCGRAPKDRLITRFQKYSPEQVTFLRNEINGRSIAELTALFNSRFGTEIPGSKIRALVKNHGMASGVSTRFKKGHKSWNKGTRGIVKPNSGNFKKGHVPANRKPLGHERICSKTGFILIKIAEKNPYTGSPTRYRHKHVYVWEQENGPVPDGMVVAFRDGDKLNTDPENLMLISRAELLRLNKHGYKDAYVELKSSILTLVKLETKTFALKK